MSYIKLNEVTLVDTSVEPNLLVEVDGEIKRMPAENLVTPQAQSDWNETDPTKPGYILNKPESLGGGKVITYTTTWTNQDGSPIDKQQLLGEWNAGSILRYKVNDSMTTNITAVKYGLVSGSEVLTVIYLTEVGYNVHEIL